MNCVFDGKKFYTTTDDQLFSIESSDLTWTSLTIPNTTTVELASTLDSSEIMIMATGRNIRQFGLDLSSSGNYSNNHILSTAFDPYFGNLTTSKKLSTDDYTYINHTGGSVNFNQTIVLFGEFQSYSGSYFDGIIVITETDLNVIPISNLTYSRGYFAQNAVYILTATGNGCQPNSRYRLQWNLDLHLICSENKGSYLTSNLIPVENTIKALRQVNSNAYVDSYDIIQDKWTITKLNSIPSRGCIISNHDNFGKSSYLYWSSPAIVPLSVLSTTDNTLTPATVIGLAISLALLVFLLTSVIVLLLFKKYKLNPRTISHQNLCLSNDNLPTSVFNDTFKKKETWPPTLTALNLSRDSHII